MEMASIHSLYLAESEIWSELMSLLVFLLFLAVPAIIRVIAERNKTKEGHIKTEQSSQNTVRGAFEKERKLRQHKSLSDWDRRQQQIRERLSRLGTGPQAVQPPRQPQTMKPPVQIPHESLPVAMPIPEKTFIPAQRQAPKPTVARAQTMPAVRPSAAALVASQATATNKSKTMKQIKRQPATRLNPIIEQIINSSNPLKAGIILKEILDKPAALRTGTDLYSA